MKVMLHNNVLAGIGRFQHPAPGQVPQPACHIAGESNFLPTFGHKNVKQM
jgi:hypothetical protein